MVPMIGDRLGDRRVWRSYSARDGGHLIKEERIMSLADELQKLRNLRDSAPKIISFDSPLMAFRRISSLPAPVADMAVFVAGCREL